MVHLINLGTIDQPIPTESFQSSTERTLHKLRQVSQELSADEILRELADIIASTEPETTVLTTPRVLQIADFVARLGSACRKRSLDPERKPEQASGPTANLWTNNLEHPLTSAAIAAMRDHLQSLSRQFKDIYLVVHIPQKNSLQEYAKRLDIQDIISLDGKSDFHRMLQAG